MPFIAAVLLSLLSPLKAQMIAQNYEDASAAMSCWTVINDDKVAVIRDGQSLAAQARPLNCKSPTGLPDMSQRTILGVQVSGGGCSASYEQAVYRDDEASKVVLVVIMHQKGRCRMLIRKDIWVSVPSFPADYEVTSNITLDQVE